MWLKLASPPSTSIQGTLYTICRVQQRLQQLNMPHQLAPPLASTAKTAPFQPVAPCPSFSKYPRKSHSAFKPETKRPRFFGPGEAPPRGWLLYVQHQYMCSIERLFARMFVRLRCGVSCATCGHVPLYAITATATATVCDHVVASWLWLWHRVSAVASWP